MYEQIHSAKFIKQICWLDYWTNFVGEISIEQILLDKFIQQIYWANFIEQIHLAKFIEQIYQVKFIDRIVGQTY